MVIKIQTLDFLRQADLPWIWVWQYFCINLSGNLILQFNIYDTPSIRNCIHVCAIRNGLVKLVQRLKLTHTQESNPI